jgi:dihydroneopterin aldolase
MPEITIHLKQLQFFAHHGVYDHERLNGNNFLVDVEVRFTRETLPLHSIGQTLNYEQLFQLVANRMKIPTPLLETIVTDLHQSIAGRFPQVKAGKISIEKCRPPVTNWDGSVVVSLAW